MPVRHYISMCLKKGSGYKVIRLKALVPMMRPKALAPAMI